MKYSVTAIQCGERRVLTPVDNISDAEKNAPVVLVGCADVTVFVHRMGDMANAEPVDMFTVTPDGINR